MHLTSEDLGRIILSSRLQPALRTLTFRERMIITMRYGIDETYIYTQAEVGRIFKVTRQCIQQDEIRAIRKFQHPARARKLKDFLNTSARLNMPNGMVRLVRRIVEGL